MASELKPCPFCGGQPSIHHGGSRQYPETFICCEDTECMGYHYPQDEQPGWNHDGTAEAWNKRVAAYTEADLAARVEAERVAVLAIIAADEKAHKGYVGCNPALIGPRIADAIRALGPTPAYDAAIQAAYKQGWNDREGDFMAGTARIGIDDAAIQAARVEGMEAAATAIATSVVLSVAELPDRNSPEGEPDMMLVTSDELFGIVEAAIRAAKDQPA